MVFKSNKILQEQTAFLSKNQYESIYLGTAGTKPDC